MPFRSPTLNLNANIWPAQGDSQVPPPAGLNFLTTPCQIRVYRTAFLLNAAELNASLIGLVLAKGSVIGSAGDNNAFADLVEVPANSQRFYLVVAVEDVAKGFDNEYRLAALVRVFNRM